MVVIFNCGGRVEEAKKNVGSRIGKDVCESHVEAVWEKVSQFIINSLCSGKGVRIPGLVTFNYKIFGRERSQKLKVVERVPFMLISQNLAKKYDLKFKKPAFNFDITAVPLNLSQIMIETCLPRSTVEICIDEVIQAFARALVCENHVEFHFPNIGRLVIKCREVEQFFCSSFMQNYGFGQEVLKDKSCPKLP